MIKTVFFTFLISAFIFIACDQDEYPLPTPKTTDTAFGANDTNYVELSPEWNNANLDHDFADPHDITIGMDDIIYVADTGNDQIVAMSKSGEILTHDGLDHLKGIPHPTGVSVDSKLNVLISNQSNTVYCWNQYFNFTQIDSAATEALFYNSETNKTVQMTFSDYVTRLKKGESELEITDILFENNQSWIDRARTVYPIYVTEESGSSINGVAAGQYGSDLFYLTESNYDRITEIRLVPDMAVKTNGGSVLFRYQGIHSREIASYGSGAGTVDDPWAIEVDEEGHIYFTQLGGNFRVQKLEWPDFEPAYILGVHDIMDLGRFKSPTDIELDDQNAIFVIDRENRDVSKFHNAGRRAGQQAYLGKKGLVTALFEGAKGILAENGIVYVLESGENRIRRFQYSISEEDVPDDDKKP